MMDDAAQAELALLLEVAGTPKPGNVDRARDLPALRFEHFLAGAVGARAGFERAANGDPIGAAFETAIEGMANQSGGNTQFGACLLLVPLVAASRRADGPIAPGDVEAIVAETTVDDAVAFYRAPDHVDLFVSDPPADAPELDLRRGRDAIGAIEERGVTLADVMAMASDYDDVAAEWTEGFEQSFWAAERIASLVGPVAGRGAATYLQLLAKRPDTLVARRRGDRTAHRVMTRAQAAREGGADLIEAFAESLVEEGINPGTTADIVAAGLYVALQRGDVAV